MSVSRPASLVPLLLVLAVACTESPANTQSPGSQPSAGGAQELAIENAFPGQKAFDRPVFLTWHASDPGYHYVVEQPGRVLRIPADGTKGDREVFFDWTEQTYTEHMEEGLLGFAFDPDYAKSRAFFVYWSHGLPKGKRESVISRFLVKDGKADPKSERVVIRIAQPAGNHNGGTIVFGPDKMLYVALGDGGAAGDPWGNGQNKKALLGKILRLDVLGGDDSQPYRIPKDNPFVGDPNAAPEVWCWGMRNPWRIAFDRATGDLWCGDVGQDLWEEVDKLEKGKNYGWNYHEGMHPFPPGSMRDVQMEHALPVAEYSHKDGGLSVTGGHVYRGTKLPALVGAFLYADWVTGKIWCVREDKARPGQAGTLLLTTKKPIASFAEEPDGESLILCFDGKIYRLVPKR